MLLVQRSKGRQDCSGAWNYNVKNEAQQVPRRLQSADARAFADGPLVGIVVVLCVLRSVLLPKDAHWLDTRQLKDQL